MNFNLTLIISTLNQNTEFGNILYHDSGHSEGEWERVDCFLQANCCGVVRGIQKTQTPPTIFQSSFDFIHMTTAF